MRLLNDVDLLLNSDSEPAILVSLTRDSASCATHQAPSETRMRVPITITRAIDRLTLKDRQAKKACDER